MAVSEEKEAILQDMEEHKREIQLAVEELAQVAKTWPSPRERIRSRPGAWLLGGFVFGVLIGTRHRQE
jgi:hypothetical protein